MGTGGGTAGGAAGCGAWPGCAVLQDDFNRANEDPVNTNWTVFLNDGLRVVTNELVGPAVSNGGAYYSATQCNIDCDAYFTWASNNSVTTRFYARTTFSGGINGYALRLVTATTVRILRVTSGVETTIGDFSIATIADGHKLGISVRGTTIEAWADQGSGWTMLGSASDSTHSTQGFVGITTNSSNGEFDDLFFSP